MSRTPRVPLDSPLNPQPFLTVGQAAAFLGVSPWTLRNWDKAGRLKPARHPKNGYRIYRREQLEAIAGVADGPNGSAAPGDRLAPPIDWDDTAEGAHVVQFYESDGYLMDAVAAFAAPAITDGDGFVMVVTETHRRGIEKRLAARGVDVAGAIDSGILVPLDAAQALSRIVFEGEPHPARFADVVGRLVARMSEGGRRCPRAFGEMVALLWGDGKRASAIRLEGLWCDLQKVQRFTLLCAYPLRLFAARGEGRDGGHYLGDVCGCHSRVLPAESYSSLPTSDQRLRAITLLQQKAASLEAEIAARKEVEQVLWERERELRKFREDGEG